eukprot:tig00020710_g13329.t1
MYNGPPRGGNRGGADMFKWDDVKHDKNKECYLGYSVKLTNNPTFNCRRPNSLWYASGESTLPTLSKQHTAAEEIAAIKKAEQDMIDEALGIKKKKNVDDVPKLDASEIRDLTRRRDDKEEVPEGVRIQGLGFAPAPHHEGVERDLLPGAQMVRRQLEAGDEGVQSAVEGTVKPGEAPGQAGPGPGGPGPGGRALPSYKQFKKLPKEQRKSFPKEIVKQIKATYKAEKKAAKKAAKEEKKRKRAESSDSSSSEGAGAFAPAARPGGGRRRLAAAPAPRPRLGLPAPAPALGIAPQAQALPLAPTAEAGGRLPAPAPALPVPAARRARSRSASPARVEAPSPPRRRPADSPPRRRPAAADSPPRRDRDRRDGRDRDERRRSRSRSRSRSPPRRGR